MFLSCFSCFFQAEDGIRDLVRSRGLGDVYKRQDEESGQTIISGMGELHLEILVDRMKREFGVEANVGAPQVAYREAIKKNAEVEGKFIKQSGGCLLYTSDAADERSSVDLGGRRIIKKKKQKKKRSCNAYVVERDDSIVL